MVYGFLITSFFFSRGLRFKDYLRKKELEGKVRSFEAFKELISGFLDFSAEHVVALDSLADFGPHVDLLSAERHGSGSLAQDAGLI